MAKDSSISSSKPWAALAALVLIAGSEAAFQMQATDPLCGAPLLEPIVDDAALMVKRELIHRCEGAIVLAGDSSCLTGLRAREMEQALGLPVVNLGTLSSHTTHGYADYVEEALRHKPRAIVVALLPQSIELAEWRVRIFRTYSRHLLATGRRNPQYPIDARDHLELYRHRREFNVFPPEFGGTYSRYRNDLLRENGWYPEKKTYDRADFLREEFVPTELSSSGVDRMIAAAVAAGVTVHWYWSPHPSEVMSESYRAAVQAWTAGLRKRWPATNILRTTVPAWPREQFGSVTHLTPAGATRNSAELTARLKP